MAAGCLLAAAAISGFTLFAQVPGVPGAADDANAVPSLDTGEDELPALPGTTGPAPGAGNPNASGFAPRATAAPPGAAPGGVPVPGTGAPGALPPSNSGFGAPGGAAPSGAGVVGQGGKGPARGRSGGAVPGKKPGMSSGSMGGGGAPGMGGMMGAGGGMPMMSGSGMMMPGGGGGMPGIIGLPNSPEMALDGEIKSALKAYRTHANEPETRAELVKTISNHIAEQFKIRQERREAEIKAIETELARVKQLHESRVANQEAIIAARLKELLSTADGLGWDLPDDSQAAPASGFGAFGGQGSRR